MAFYKNSHLNLVLYRPQWGKTVWTGIEYDAIADRCKNDRFKSLFLVHLDKTDPLPMWLPEYYVRFNMQDFSFEVSKAILTHTPHRQSVPVHYIEDCLLEPLLIAAVGGIQRLIYRCPSEYKLPAGWIPPRLRK
ncbi:MAG TPA: hypothetical protein VMW18_09600 [Candidatus Binatia bacterium]|nr:hypothetical protein [Candidatus Binatia bacterium]